MAASGGSVSLFSSFWSEKYWLLENVTWADIKALRNPKFNQLGGLYFAFPVAILLIFVRIFFERFIARPIVCYLGVKDKKVVIEANPLCEKVYRSDGHSPAKDMVEHLSQQLGWSAKQVQRWFRRRRNSSRESVLNKATASSWRFVFYLTAAIYGFLVLHKKQFFWDLKHCYISFPSQHVLTDDLFFYYLLEMACYISMTVLQFFEEKKKDFWQMMLHHLVTMFMISVSYMVGYIRIGAVIMLVHDISDVFLELAKVLNYAKIQKLCDAVFVIFTITFYLTRLLYFPFCVFDQLEIRHEKNVFEFLERKKDQEITQPVWRSESEITRKVSPQLALINQFIPCLEKYSQSEARIALAYSAVCNRILHAHFFVNPSIVGMYSRWYIDVSVLSTLQCLHIFWGFLISKMVYQFTVVGKVAKDERSNEDHSSGAEDKQSDEVVQNGAPLEVKKNR